MKIIPKFANGGEYEQYFTSYTPMSRKLEVSEGSSSRGPSRSSDSGELTEKDFFNMLKEINGLPNEMNEIVSNLTTTLRLRSLEGYSTEDLATTYLKNLYQIKVAAQNKERYDEAIKTAQENGSMTEPAIDSNGNLYVQFTSGENEGKITTITPSEYFSNQGNYSLLSTSNLANMRAYDMRLVGDQHIFDVIENSMGYEAFQKLLDQAKIQLGHTTSSESVLYRNQNQALQGLESFEGMSEEQKQQAIQAIQNGYTGESTKVKSNLEQIQSYVNYLAVTLPQRARTWAMIKTGETDQRKAVTQLVGSYLIGRKEIENTHTVNYRAGSNNRKSTGESGLYDDIELNASMKWLAGYGNQKQFIINPGTSKQYVVLSNGMPLTNKEKKYVGVNGTLQEVSSGDYSGILDFNNASIGGNIVNTVNFGQVILRDGNIYSIDLPYDVDRYNRTGEIVPLIDENKLRAKKEADQEIKNVGIDLTKQSSIKQNIKKINEIYSSHGLGNIYNVDGSPIWGWKRFGVINVYASNKTIGTDDLDSNILLREITDDNIINNLINITGDEKFDVNNWYDLNGHDSFYEGTLYIPIDSSYVAASANISMDQSQVQSLDIGDQSLNQNFDYGQIYQPQ